MYRIFSIVIIAFIVVSTLLVVILKPEMHKEVLIYDSAYTIVQADKVSTETKELPTTSAVKTDKKIVREKINNINKIQPVTKETEKIQTAKKTTTAVTKTSSQKQQVSTKVVKTTKPVQTKQVKTNTVKSKPAAKTKTVAKQKNTTVSKPATPAKTAAQTQQSAEQTELIKWNKWRSDIQNQLMKDVRLPIVPQGTVFKFQFDVDKYGKVTNIQTWSTNASFTPFAIQYIAPVIKSYQGRSILNFPQGSNRIATTVEGGWKISNTTKYSTPSDFKDIEKVRN